MSQKTQPADFDPSSLCAQISRAAHSLYEKLVIALRADENKNLPDRVRILIAVKGNVYTDGQKPQQASDDAQVPLLAQISRRLQWLVEQLAADPSGDPHFLAFCSAVAEMLLSF